MPTWDKLVMPWSEAYQNLGASSLLTTFLSKKGAISEGDFLMDRVSDYFSEFKPLVNEWRSQIHLTEIDTNATVIHDHIFQMLVMFIMKLEDLDENHEIPIPIPIQSQSCCPVLLPSLLLFNPSQVLQPFHILAQHGLRQVSQAHTQAVLNNLFLLLGGQDE
ncbi:uncharacterized protein HD556DRAFT_1438513 [Suillus plorans]|uniref:Uncharacterized protein n=1 Tax=Suillus plorans TaxID=116603 RepID=A0A9P7DRS6_9AGAM|nr:uncharacterized protein HD556DRAFT_1438513 [Suillus plorans]KAG1801491.1 hypothetical protein HD556DRAFT_1438513 [Suillus plorans]